jgi:cyanophycinase
MTRRFCQALLLTLVVQICASAQTFDERMSDWPMDLSLAGTVMASPEPMAGDTCQQTFLAAAASHPGTLVCIHFGEKLWRRSWPDTARICNFLVTSEGDTTIVQRLGENSTATDEADLRQQLGRADGVQLCSRGQVSPGQRQLLQRLQPGLREVVKRGGVVWACGDLCRGLGRYEIVGSMEGEQPEPARIVTALQLIPDVVIQTAFQRESARPQLLSVLAAHPRMVGIGMDPQTTLILQGRKIRAAGAGELHFLTMANERRPLRRKSISQPTSGRFNPYESLVDLTAWRRDAIDRTLEPFPPARPPLPLVENGTLLIAGGGGLPEGLMDRFIELAGGRQARLVYIPCTRRERISDRQRQFVELWKEREVASADVVHTKDRRRANQDEDLLKPLRQATGIFFGGGRQWNFSDSWYGTEAHRLMKDVLRRGGVIAGSSAGASIQARYLARANPLGNIDIMAPGYERGGLGFIGGVAIDQHFTQRGRQPDMSQLVNRYPQLLGIGIDERTALVVRKSVAEVVGENAVFIYDRRQFAAHDRPDYLKLGAGQKYDLAKRKVVPP